MTPAEADVVADETTDGANTVELDEAVEVADETTTTTAAEAVREPEAEESAEAGSESVIEGAITPVADEGTDTDDLEEDFR